MSGNRFGPNSTLLPPQNTHRAFNSTSRGIAPRSTFLLRDISSLPIYTQCEVWYGMLEGKFPYSISASLFPYHDNILPYHTVLCPDYIHTINKLTQSFRSELIHVFRDSRTSRIVSGENVLI